MSEPNFPTAEELQKKLTDFMKSQFGNQVSVSTQIAAPEEGGGTGPALGRAGEEPFDFRHLPRDIKAHLDRYVIRQDDAKRVLAIAVCDHYNNVNYMRKLAREDEKKARETEYTKQNVILLGPTGVGKTYLVKHIAELVGVPFVKADATKFSETGYVGGDVEDLVRELVQRANGDVELAQYGIVYIDEVDKIASTASPMGRDVSGRGVQTALLKLMEETEVPLRAPNDIQGNCRPRSSSSAAAASRNARPSIPGMCSSSFPGRSRKSAPSSSAGCATRPSVSERSRMTKRAPSSWTRSRPGILWSMAWSRNSSAGCQCAWSAGS